MRACVGAREQACAFTPVALLIQHATRIRSIICVLCGSITFFGVMSSTARFLEKVTERKMCILIFSTTFV